MAERPSLVGAVVSGYRLERLRGRGGMGDVYEARDLALGRRVAIKLLAEHLIDDPAAAERFQREIETAARIEHVGIVPVYTAGWDPASGRFYIAMRYIDGPDLHAHLEVHGPMAPARAVRALAQLGAALHAVHAEGLVHRDVKPHNVLLWAAGEPDEHALLTDFGIARAANGVGHATRSGVVVGTPPYVAPEVWRGEAAGAASDQYAMGCMAHRMLTGRGPYDELAGEWSQRHLKGAPLPLPTTVDRGLRQSIERALAKQPRDRFPTMRAFLEQLGGTEAFDRSEAVTQLIRGGADPETTQLLTTQFSLTEQTIALLTDTAPSEIIRQRRLAARRAIMGGG